MKKGREVILILNIIFFLAFLNLIPIHLDKIEYTKENIVEIHKKGERVPLTSDYTLVDPININSYSDWAKYDFITGNGSELNPYLIEDIEIQGNGIKTMEDGSRTILNSSYLGIYIAANGSFIIQNCKISSVSIGIGLTIGVSTKIQHLIKNITINNCGIGIYSNWVDIVVNISKCYISNCKWVTVKVPHDFEDPWRYGGYGIWLSRAYDSRIELCRIQNCSIGLVATLYVDLISNQLINCGFSCDFIYGIPTYRFNNTVNGKPLGIFYDEDDLTFTEQQASQYGQLLFIWCENLRLINIHIKNPCSIGITIFRCYNSLLQNIVCENQEIGFFIQANFPITSINLRAKNCEAGFFLNRCGGNSTFSNLFTDNTDVPVYTTSPILYCTIEIEKSTPFYIVDYYGYETLLLNSSVSSFTVSRSFIPALDNEGFLIQLNDTGIYHVTDIDQILLDFDFTLISIQRPLSIIPWFSSIWAYLVVIFTVLFLIITFQFNKRIKIRKSNISA